jgi:ankyrin repeat protein
VVTRDEDQRTPLLLAAAAGDAPTCQLLLRRMATYDADAINWADAGGLTPLHWALTQQRYDAAALLLRHGASSTAEDEDGRRPLHAAAFSGNARCVSLLLPHVSREGASAPSADNLTPLHYAALSGSAPVVSLLLEAGASLHAVDEEGRSALSWAAGEGHAGVCAALLAGRADPSSTDANGMGALHHAAKAGSLPCAQLLLASGASALQRSVGGAPRRRRAAAAPPPRACRPRARPRARTRPPVGDAPALAACTQDRWRRTLPASRAARAWRRWSSC